MPTQLLIIGNATRAEALPLMGWISNSLHPAEAKHFESFAEAFATEFPTAWVPDLVIVLQSWPDEYSVSDLTQLFALAPLARLVVCYGKWCESDGRTRAVWPLAVRVPMHAASQRIFLEWQILHEGNGRHVLPLSASREEVFVVDHPPIREMAEITIYVDSPDAFYQQYLVELFANAGCSTVANQSDSVNYDVVLFDADPPAPSRCNLWQAICECQSDLPVIALTSSPDTETNIEALKWAASILPKLGDQRRILQTAYELSNRRTSRDGTVSKT